MAPSKRLFLNPLNDLGAWPIAARDVFHLPDHSYSLSEQPRFVKYYDQLKQEYLAACVLLYEGLKQDSPHPADKKLLTFEHADYSVANIYIEKQKSAFRLAYSLLDKCAAFINDYFELGHDPKSLKTTFRRVWLSKNEKQLNEKIPLKNWRLRGLYSVSLDLFGPGFREVEWPLASKADAVRNAIEHRFFSVHEMLVHDRIDDNIERITALEFVELTLHTLALARSTIMGLSLAVQFQKTQLKPQSMNALRLEIYGIPKRI